MGRILTIAMAEDLKKPDMLAVLSRTHIGTNLKGFLLPILEAISNAMDGIELNFSNEAKTKGHIHVKFQSTANSNNFLVSVTDNGIGLTNENYESFRTP